MTTQAVVVDDDNINMETTINTVVEKKKVLFVTVGTTLFTKLIDMIVHPITLSILIEQYHYTTFIIQYGKGPKPILPSQYNTTTTDSNSSNIQFELYDFKSSLYNDMKKAHMIVCHAGAGTLTEAIRISQQQDSDKTIIVTVINNLLMDNHQVELAYALQRRKLVYVIDNPNDFIEREVDVASKSDKCFKIWEQIHTFGNSLYNNNDNSTTTTTTSSNQNIFHSNPYHIPFVLQSFFLSSRNTSSQSHSKHLNEKTTSLIDKSE